MKFLISVLIVFACGFILTSNLAAQDCISCRQNYSIPVRSAVVKRWQETEMVKQIQYKQVAVEVEVPVVRTYETREVFAAETRERRLRSVNWGCVAAGLQAFANCNFQKRQARRSMRGGGLFSRLLFWR